MEFHETHLFISHIFNKGMRHLIILLLLSTNSWAQDVIVRTDESKLDAKIIEITPSTIKYKKYNSADDREYKVSKNDVLEVRYENGEVEKFGEQKYTSSDYRTDFGRHFISYNALATLFSNLSVSYEYFFSTGHFSVKAPISIGFGRIDPEAEVGSSIFEIGLNKRFSIGVDFNFYPSGQGRFRYFLGTGMEYGQFNYYRIYNTYNSNPFPVYYTQEKTERVGDYIAIPFKNGLLIQPTKNFNIQLTTGIGLGRNFADYGDEFNNDGYLFYWNTSLNLGIRF